MSDSGPYSNLVYLNLEKAKPESAYFELCDSLIITDIFYLRFLNHYSIIWNLTYSPFCNMSVRNHTVNLVVFKVCETPVGALNL